jgi:hypothetical protein
MARSVRFVFAVLLAAAVSLPAGAAPDPEATFRTQRVYLHCTSDTIRENNLAGTIVTWDTTPPTGAFAGDGDGCANTQAVSQDPPVVGFVGAFRIAGTFTGNLDTMTVQLHDLGHGSLQDPDAGRVAIDVTLTVDGTKVVNRAPVVVDAASENSGVTDQLVFSIRGLDLAPEEGDGTIEREYWLTFETAPGVIFVYDAQEVPAGITFNPRVVAGPVIEVG